MKTKTKKNVKKYDAVKEVREIREQIATEIKGMTAEQILAYFNQPCLKKKA